MSLERDIDFLRNLPLLSELSPDQLRLLAFGADFRIARSGETLFQPGDQADSGYLVKSGSIGLYNDPDGGGTPDDVAGPGTLIGEMALLIDTRRTVRAIALERTELLQIRRALFRRMLEEFPEIARRLQRGLGERVGAFAREIAHVADTLDKLDSEMPPRRSGN
ncbi:MAG: cyclic nucleotide-binding domain-containing protein [Pseudomonadota bacterium]